MRPKLISRYIFTFSAFVAWAWLFFYNWSLALAIYFVMVGGYIATKERMQNE